MAYRNLTGLFGHRWISDYDKESILRKFPKKFYDVSVRFTDDQNDMPLEQVTGVERNIDRILIHYKDGTNRLDPDPFQYIVEWPVNSQIVNQFADKFFYDRQKLAIRPQTRNEDPEVIHSMREQVRRKLKNYLHVNDVEPESEAGPDRPLDVLVNAFAGENRKNLLRFLAELDKDGINTVVSIDFSCASVDQLQRIDTMMEFADLGDVVELTEN